MENKLKVNMNEYLPLRDVVFNTLRQAILKGELEPGERLMEIQHITQALLGNLRNLSALARNHEDQAFQLQFADSLTDRGTADAQTVCKLDFHQTLAWFQLTL